MPASVESVHRSCQRAALSGIGQISAISGASGSLNPFHEEVPMPPSDVRFDNWRSRREQRLARLSGLRSSPTPGGKRVWYAADELLVADDLVGHAQDTLAEEGHDRRRVGEDEVIAGVRRLRVPGLDAPGTVRRLRERITRNRPGSAPEEQNVGVNHVFLSAPVYQGGPFGPPVPAPAATLPPRAAASQGPPVVVIDTGLWTDSPIAAACEAPSDRETETDVDGDGVLDGDVGHANFIAGVILSHTTGARVRVLKVLDTFGVCTEAQLAATLNRLPAETQIVNLSLGGFTLDDRPPVALRAALRRALTGTDRVVIAAAGNDGNAADPFWPAAFAAAGEPWNERVAAVAAHDGGKLCEWSNTGAWVSMLAPGQDVTSTYIHHDEFASGWATWSGTSFAAPAVAAAVAEELRRDGSPVAALARVRARAAGSGPGARIVLP
jgi:thermitase